MACLALDVDGLSSCEYCKTVCMLLSLSGCSNREGDSRGQRRQCSRCWRTRGRQQTTFGTDESVLLRRGGGQERAGSGGKAVSALGVEQTTVSWL